MRTLIELILIDFDGTLVDSLPSAIDSVQKTIKEMGFPYKTTEEIRMNVGFGEVPLVARSLGTNDEKLIEKAMEIYFNHVDDGTITVKPYPHIKDFLEHFKHKPIIVLSNKKDRFIHKILKQNGLDHYFKEILGGDTSSCLKPDPCVVLRLIEKYKTTPERTLMVGDMTIDVETGKNAKCLSAAVTYGFDPKEKLKALDPTYLIDDILELTKLID